jgi:hypothetical protein
MPQNAFESHVALHDFHIGFADAGQPDFDFSPAGLYLRLGMILNILKFAVKNRRRHAFHISSF